MVPLQWELRFPRVRPQPLTRKTIATESSPRTVSAGVYVPTSARVDTYIKD